LCRKYDQNMRTQILLERDIRQEVLKVLLRTKNEDKQLCLLEKSLQDTLNIA